LNSGWTQKFSVKRWHYDSLPGGKKLKLVIQRVFWSGVDRGVPSSLRPLPLRSPGEAVRVQDLHCDALLETLAWSGRAGSCLAKNLKMSTPNTH
jgi:hypothetical protein